MHAFVGTLKVSTDSVNALEKSNALRFVSFYANKGVIYVYLETDSAIDALRDTWGGPSFFMEATRGVGATWERLARRRGIECVKRGRPSFEITSLVR